MKRFSDNIKSFTGENPFKDSQARSFSDTKVISEFSPTSTFWSLFNEQHEILIGTRGSGKTILLKMMRYSLLKKIDDPQAREIISQKKIIGLYVPMNLEFLGDFDYQDIAENIRLPFFQFAFNCLLVKSLLYELGSILDDNSNLILRAQLNHDLSKKISRIWFPHADNSQIVELSDIDDKISALYYSHSYRTPLNDIPAIFIKPIGTPLQAVSDIITKTLSWENTPSWLICIDEAEFLSSLFQKCINTMFRSDSKRLVIKMATLPFKHTTKETLSAGIFAEADGNDFNYRLIDMKYDSADFIKVTDTLCSKRITEGPDYVHLPKTLEAFLGKVGNDDLIDYYNLEVGDELGSPTSIGDRIVKSLSEKRQITSKKEDTSLYNRRKEFYDKFAPIFFTRELLKLSKQGNRIPGWYAGASMVRKISQGNPRRFIQIMNDLFEKARKHHLQPKAQHAVLFKYAERTCASTGGLPEHGADAISKLDSISKMLHSRVHDGPLIEAGSTFQLSITNYIDSATISWIHLAVQYLRLVIDDASIINDITNHTKYTLSNIYCAKHWIPMRAGTYPKFKLSVEKLNTGIPILKTSSDHPTSQLGIFPLENSDADVE